MNKINVLHINYSNSESSACTRIIKAQKSSNRIDPFLLSFNNLSSLNNIKFSIFERKLLFFSIFLDKIINRFNYFFNKEFFSFNFIRKGFMFKVNQFKKYDIIHFHWNGHGYIDPKDLISKISVDIPIFIHFHDALSVTGGCHVISDCQKYKTNCNDCPKSIISFHSPRNFNKKKEFYTKFNCYAISPSDFFRNYLSASYLFKFFKDDFVVPNPIELNIDINSQNRSNLDSTLRLLFISNNLNDPNKQLDKLISSLENSSFKNFNLTIVGNLKKEINPSFDFNHISYIESDLKMISIYNSVDITLITSNFETFGQVALESINAGTPVITFEGIGTSEIISQNINGILCQKNSFKSLVENLIILHNDREFLSLLKSNCNSNTIQKFSFDIIGDQYFKIYNNVIKSKNT